MTEERNAAMHSAQVAMMELAAYESQQEALEDAANSSQEKEKAAQAAEVDAIMKKLLGKTTEERDTAHNQLSIVTARLHAANTELEEFRSGNALQQLDETREALTRVAQDSAKAFMKMSNELDKTKQELHDTKQELKRFRDLSSALAASKKDTSLVLQTT